AVADDVRDALHGLRGERRAALERQHDRRAGLVLLAPDRALRGQQQVHLGTLDALDLADRARELALERALVGDALREVGHAPRRLVEQLEAGPAVRRQAALR